MIIFPRSINERVVTLCDEKSVPLSNSVELKSVSVVSSKFESICHERTMSSMFSIGDASRDVLVFS